MKLHPFFRRVPLNRNTFHSPTTLAARAHGLLTIIAWCITLGLIGVSLFVLYAKSRTPDPESIVSRQVKESTKIYDRTGTVVLYDIFDEEKRTVVPWDRMGENIKHATLAVEDSGFYEHKGFDIKGIARSLLRNVERGYGSGGGSTLTQQLVGNALVGREKTITRKVEELILAIEVERRFTKDQIFEMYLNQVPYGSNAYGIEAASQTYFGTPAADLTIAQAALLASLVQRPSYLSPYGSHRDELMARKDYVIGRMFQLGYISEQARNSALAETLTFKPKSSALVAPHFVVMAREYVTQKYGSDIVSSGGFKIITTLDAELQKKAEELVAKYAAINKEKYKASNAALVALDPKTGGVLALVGSANYFDTENEGNYNVATAQRQPGSAFKPFAYAAAFAKGFPDTTVLWDVKTEFNPLCPPDASAKKDSTGQDCYHPQNYNGKYSGPVTLRQSLARSLNTTSVKTLYLAGVDDTIDLATRMGITTLSDRSRFGLSLVLGGAEVRPVDLVSAYGVFANEGIRTPWSMIQRIEANDGTVLEERRATQERVLDAQTARLVNDVLSDNGARSAVFGANNALVVPGRDVAAKTGTTQENRDAWVVGYTPSIATVVWIGNNRNQSMTAAGAGISAAGPLWNAFMVSALNSTPAESFVKPDPIVTNKIMLNGLYVSQEYPQPHSILWYVDRNDPTGPFPAYPDQDPQFKNWEAAVSAQAGLGY
ncbi:MAG: penicillin-binding protein [Candidatus Yanofskybacteria bacterium]|nr:penicillin-binding protein [Candidatus Yanofskybacteria bacterium]